MVTSVVGALEEIRVLFTLLGFKSWKVYFVVGFATPCKVAMIF